ncbi:MAG: amino acid ABC transporter substrate-binding protein [Bacteroidia bacterium]|nr:amino acid ABC transporter substrate-binding protein [Bacteroidia bacterium]
MLLTDELKNTDLIVGPLFFGTATADENKIVQDFSFANQVNLLNPISNNMETVADNPFGYLLQPSYETLGRKAGDLLATANGGAPVSNCLVLYGNTRKDSVMAANFVQVASEKGVKIVASEKIAREDSRKVIQILATPTEYDQWKKPIEFTLGKDSLASIYVASDDPLIYSKVISSMETRGDSITIVGSESWLEGNAVPFEKYQRLGVVFASPNYTRYDQPYYRAFVRKYIQTNGHAPSDFAELGYEAMLFTGHMLGQYGVYFQDAINKDRVLPGYLSEGYSFYRSRSNLVVPFVKFKDGELIRVDQMPSTK